jgi:hypothetical protein
MPKHKKEKEIIAIAKKSVMNRGISLYNKVPVQIKLRENVNLFEKDLKSLLVNHSFYSVEEFVILNF